MAHKARGAPVWSDERARCRNGRAAALALHVALTDALLETGETARRMANDEGQES